MVNIFVSISAQILWYRVPLADMTLIIVRIPRRPNVFLPIAGFYSLHSPLNAILQIRGCANSRSTSVDE
jgi:hypothetical protein